MPLRLEGKPPMGRSQRGCPYFRSDFNTTRYFLSAHVGETSGPRVSCAGLSVITLEARIGFTKWSRSKVSYQNLVECSGSA
jgi:hypothetical protein